MRGKIMILKTNIAEYDMANAGIAVLYNKGLLDYDTYNKMTNLPKKEREVKTGILIRDNPTWYQIQTEEFKKYIDLFIRTNKLLAHNILEVVRDGVWVIGRKPKELSFSDNVIIFKEKNPTTIYFRYKRNIHFYVNSFYSTIRVRGINPDNRVFLDVIKDILIDFENNLPVYEKLHEVRNNLMSDEKYYGKDLGVKVSNIKIIEKLIKEML